MRVLSSPGGIRFVEPAVVPRVFLAVGLILAVALVTTPHVRAGDRTPYRVVGPSYLTVSTGANVPPVQQAVALRGTFVLEATAGPLDWEVSLVEDVDWKAAGGVGPVRIEGSGYHRVGGRGAASEELNLTARVNGLDVALASGVGRQQRAWPFIQLDLTGSVTNGLVVSTYGIHLVAIRDLGTRHYEVVGDSTVLDDCAICDRLSLPQPLRGGFDLVTAEQSPVSNRYYLTDIAWASGTGPGAGGFNLTGEGELQFGGEVVVQQSMSLVLTKTDAVGTREVKVVNVAPVADQPWPLMLFELSESEGTPVSRLDLHVRAAPMLGLWFSVSRGLTPSQGPRVGVRCGGSEVLDWRGGVVFNGAELYGALALTNAVDDLNIDALDVADDGTVSFSFDRAVQSSRLGTIGSGDLLTDAGGRAVTGTGLLAAFGVDPGASGVGIDAVQLQGTGMALFSIDKAVKSPKLGVTLGAGDVLRQDGVVLYTAQTLLAAFQPGKDVGDPGLDALHVWSNGEVWFSTQQRWSSGTAGTILDGDLLSSRGYVVARNSELIARFAPLEDLVDFGLDALFVVPEGAGWDASQPRLRSMAVAPGAGSVVLRWAPTGRPVRVERTTDLAAPFQWIVSPVAGTEFRDAFLPSPGVTGFYRLSR